MPMYWEKGLTNVCLFVCLVFNACTEWFYFIYIMVTGQTSTGRKAGIKEPDHGKYN